MQRALAGWMLACAACMGECVPDTLLADLDEARTLWELARDEEARKALRDASKSASPCLTNIRVGNTLADLSIRMGKTKDALKFARIVEGASSKEFGERSLQRAVSLETLAQALAVNRKEIEAEPLIRESISIVDEHGGQSSVFKARLLNLLATLHAKLDDPEGAQRQLERAWAIVGNSPDEPMRVVIMHNLGAAALRQGRKEEAQARMAEVQKELDRLPRSVQREIQSWSSVKSLR